jgi:uncharacterized protein
MSGPAVVMLIAWFAAILGPVVGVLIWRRLRRRPWRAATLLLLPTLAYGLGVWAFLVEPQLLVVRHVAIASSAWRGPPLRIGVVSDTHVGEAHVTPQRVRRTMARLSAERPDLVVFLGDYAGGHLPAAVRSTEQREAIQDGVAALAEVKAPLGRVAMLGNHDWWYDGSAIEAGLRRAGVPTLENAALRIARPAGDFWIAGLADLHSDRAKPSPDLALRDVPAEAPVIVLTHWPDPFAQVPDRVALTLAGHSHCGQVNLPLVGRPILPSPGSARWPCGLYAEGSRQLYVTGGVGVSILPVRFRAPPEIVIVTVSARP